MSWYSNTRMVYNAVKPSDNNSVENTTIRKAIIIRLLISGVVLGLTTHSFFTDDPAEVANSYTKLLMFIGISGVCTLFHASAIWRVTRIYKIFNHLWFLGEILLMCAIAIYATLTGFLVIFIFGVFFVPLLLGILAGGSYAR